MQVIEFMEVWRGGQYVDTITVLSNDLYPEVIALLPETVLQAGDSIRPLIAGGQE